MLAGADGGRLLAELQAEGKITLPLPDGPIELDGDDIQVRLQAKEGWAAAQGRGVVVVLATALTAGFDPRGTCPRVGAASSRTAARTWIASSPIGSRWAS